MTLFDSATMSSLVEENGTYVYQGNKTIDATSNTANPPYIVISGSKIRINFSTNSQLDSWWFQFCGTISDFVFVGSSYNANEYISYFRNGLQGCPLRNLYV